MQPIGLFGGTFDPLHYGHMRTAFELVQALQPRRSAFHAHRQPAASRTAACAGAGAACDGARRRSPISSAFVVDDREMRRTGVSYSVDTLTELRAEYPQALAVSAVRDGCVPGSAQLASLARAPGSCAYHRRAPAWLACAHDGTARRGHGRSRHGQRARSARAARGAHLCARRDAAGDFLDRAAAADRRGTRSAAIIVPEEVRRIIRETRCYAVDRAVTSGRHLS